MVALISWELAQAWPDSELVIVNSAGHASTEPGMGEALIAATDRFARACQTIDLQGLADAKRG